MAQSGISSPAESLSVLIVDYFEAIRESLRAFLTGAGHRVAVASDSNEATELINATEFDAAIIDFEMPGPDGLILLQTIQEKYPLLPVIVVSSAIDAPRAIQLVNAGVFKVAWKPVAPEWLLSALVDASRVNDIRTRAASWSERSPEEATPAQSESEPQRSQEQINA